eukprot:GEMP01035666.1.p1 GENE.GEMP01035666.1~~GEMP01035666.1.p1  ORF type:complete len:428 (+),score=52.54 GEMP01035666.1:316-1599(+)
MLGSNTRHATQMSSEATHGIALFARLSLLRFHPEYIRRAAIFCALLMMLIGLMCTITAWGVHYIELDYINGELNMDSPVRAFSEISSSDDNTFGGYEFTLSTSMEPPIYLYFKLDGFYQNNMTYQQSIDESPLSTPEGLESPIINRAEAVVPGCERSEMRPPYPCGEVAQTIFTDTFRIFKRTDTSISVTAWKEVTVNSSASAVSWPSNGEDKRYRNLDPDTLVQIRSAGPKRPALLAYDMHILRHFPPVRCEPKYSTRLVPLPPAYVAMRSEGADGGAFLVVDCVDWTSSSPRCNFTLTEGSTDGQQCGDLGDYAEEIQTEWGVESPRFLNWARRAATDPFQKLIGVIRDDTFLDGEILRIFHHRRFNATPNITRYAVLTTVSWIGQSRNFALAIVYLVNGFIALLVCCKHDRRRRHCVQEPSLAW